MRPRMPNYDYTPNEESGGYVIRLPDGTTVWGKTKSAARARILRILKRKYHAKTTAEIYAAMNQQA